MKNWAGRPLLLATIISSSFLRGLVLCLFPEEALAEDAMVHSKPQEGFRGITLAHNVASKKEVDHFLQFAAKAGAKIVKVAQEVFWGGYSGYFADPSGHLWEVAYNPFWPLQADGTLKIPEE
jgi:catechol 2,3-dioxygenase-like lactoylglutathione lyase family enzyme